MKRSKKGILFLIIMCILICGCQKNIDDKPIDDGIKQEDDDVIVKYNDVVVTTDALNFRESPSTDAAVIKTFYKNEELQVFDRTKDDEWLLVKNNGVMGYVSSEYTISAYDMLKETYPDTTLKSIEVKKIVHTTDNLNVRRMPGLDFVVLETLEKFVSVRVLDETDEWYFVMTNEFTFGYISKEYTQELTDTYVIVDKSVQRLYLYNNLDLTISTPVTTGKNSTPSDTGKFQIYNKEKGRYLVGADYRTWVDYWMPYNMGEGLHDATWHNLFGSQGYKTGGSHGCINLPPDIADDIYDNVYVGTTVLVHQ